eukprot:scaffold46517_cov50-Phaeocystis_antarctica.AAC.5
MLAARSPSPSTKDQERSTGTADVKCRYNNNFVPLQEILARKVSSPRPGPLYYGANAMEP